MRVNKKSNLTYGRQQVKNYANDLDADIKTIILALQGKLRFGDAVTGENGENISGAFVTFISSGTPDAENTIPHDVGSVPKGYIVLWQDKAGSVYQGPATGTAWTASNIYLKCNVASVTFNLFLLR